MQVANFCVTNGLQTEWLAKQTLHTGVIRRSKNIVQNFQNRMLVSFRTTHTLANRENAFKETVDFLTALVLAEALVMQIHRTRHLPNHHHLHHPPLLHFFHH